MILLWFIHDIYKSPSLVQQVARVRKTTYKYVSATQRLQAFLRNDQRKRLIRRRRPFSKWQTVRARSNAWKNTCGPLRGCVHLQYSRRTNRQVPLAATSFDHPHHTGTKFINLAVKLAWGVWILNSNLFVRICQKRLFQWFYCVSFDMWNEFSEEGRIFLHIFKNLTRTNQFF